MSAAIFFAGKGREKLGAPLAALSGLGVRARGLITSVTCHRLSPSVWGLISSDSLKLAKAEKADAASVPDVRWRRWGGGLAGQSRVGE